MFMHTHLLSTLLDTGLQEMIKNQEVVKKQNRRANKTIEL